MLLWYTADQPGILVSLPSPHISRTGVPDYTDERVDLVDATQKAYSTIKSLDRYHLVALCHNCQNYHFEEYTAGTDTS